MSSGETNRKIHSVKLPVKRIEDTKSILIAIKKCDRLALFLSISCEFDANFDKSAFISGISRLCKKTKYCSYFKINRDPLYTSTHINRILSQIKRFNTMRGLKLYCSNSNVTARVNNYSCLKSLKHFNHLETVIIHIFFVAKMKQLFDKFGSLVQSFRAKNITIKEPLAFMPERYVKRFYSKLRDTGKRLTSLKLSHYAPFNGPIETFAPYKFLENITYLDELHLSFIGMAARNCFLSNLLGLFLKIENLSSITLDLSFNQISNLGSLCLLQCLPLKKIDINFSYNPLNRTSFSHLVDFLYSLPELTYLKLGFCSVKMEEKSLSSITAAIRSLKKLTFLGLNLNENRCIDTMILHIFFSHLFSSPYLRKVELGLARALIGGFPSEFVRPIQSKKSSLYFLNLDFSNNRLHDSEILQLVEFLRGYTSLEELKLSLENCKLGDKAAEAIWEWLASLNKLRSLEISLLFSDINEICLLSMLRTLLKTKLENLVLDLTDVVNSKSAAEVVWLAILAMKGLKSFKICSSFLKEVLPSKFVEITKLQLPNCSRFEISC